MKKIFLFLTLITGLAFAQVNDRTEYRLVFSDSISNSQAKTIYVDLQNIESYDSVGIALVQYGAVSMDSVITYALGFRGNLPKGNFGSILASAFGSGTNLVLSADQTTTGTNSAYGVVTTRLSKAALIPYPTLRLTITALSSGNTASQTAQRVGVFVIFYR